jgi:hypothetical protein
MQVKSLRRLIVTFASVMMLVLAFAPLSYAGEDGCDDDSCGTSHASGGGGSDTGSAKGGAQTGFGGVLAANDGNVTAPFTLASGGVVLLTLAGGLALRGRRNEQ